VKPRSKAAALASLGLATAIAAYAVLVRPRRIRLREVELALPRWPAELDGLRVAVITDLHAGAVHVGEEAVGETVEMANVARPDLVVLLGDYVDPAAAFAREVPPERVAARLAGLEAPLGVLAVLGNHDRKHDPARIEAALEDAGIRVLRDEVARLEPRGVALDVVGAREGERRPARSGPLPVPESDAAATLLLSHNPDVFPRVPERVALTLSGHTHGAQVDVPVLRGLVIPSRHGTRFKDGHVVEDGRHLFVCRGVGTSGFPVRLGAPPEVAVLALRSAR
jgi:predicted MPP superfamily phosphohydrolase